MILTIRCDHFSSDMKLKVVSTDTLEKLIDDIILVHSALKDKKFIFLYMGNILDHHKSFDELCIYDDCTIVLACSDYKMRVKCFLLDNKNVVNNSTDPCVDFLINYKITVGELGKIFGFICQYRSILCLFTE